MKIAKHPNGDKIEFYEDTHTYIHNGVEYDSVTTIIHHLFPEFDTENISKRYAAKYGLNQQDVIKEWEETNRIACEFGTRIHEFCESRIRLEPFNPPTDDKELKYCLACNKFIDKLLKVCDVLACEQILFSPKFKLAGTVDLVLRNKSNDEIMICDWKTNKSIDNVNDWGERGLKFLSHLDHCNFNHYSLQLNIYRVLLHFENYFDCMSSKMKLFHITEHGVDIISIDKMDKEISKLLQNRI